MDGGGRPVSRDGRQVGTSGPAPAPSTATRMSSMRLDWRDDAAPGARGSPSCLAGLNQRHGGAPHNRAWRSAMRPISRRVFIGGTALAGAAVFVPAARAAGGMGGGGMGG